MLCPNCRQNIPDGAPACPFCHTTVQPPRKAAGRTPYIALIALSAALILASALIFILDPWGAGTNAGQSAVLSGLLQKQFAASYYTNQALQEPSASSRPSYADWQTNFKKALGLWQEIEKESAEFSQQTAALRLDLGSTACAAGSDALVFLDTDAAGDPLSEYAQLLNADAKTASDTLTTLQSDIDDSVYADSTAFGQKLASTANTLDQKIKTSVLAGEHLATGSKVKTQTGDLLAAKGAELLVSVDNGYGLGIIADKPGQDVVARVGEIDLSAPITLTAAQSGGEARTFKTPALSDEMKQAVAGLVLDLSDMANKTGTLTTATAADLNTALDQADIEPPEWLQDAGGALTGLDTDQNGGGDYDPDMPKDFDLDTFVVGDWEAQDYWNSELDANGHYTKTTREDSDYTFIAHFYAGGTVVFDGRHNASGDVSKILFTYSWVVDGAQINLTDENGNQTYTFYYNPSDGKIYTVNPDRLNTNGTYKTYTKVG